MLADTASVIKTMAGEPAIAMGDHPRVTAVADVQRCDSTPTAHTPQWATAQSAGTSLKLPRCFEGVLNGAIVAFD